MKEITSLAELRDSLLAKLARIETLARAHFESPADGCSAQVRSLREKLSTLEAGKASREAEFQRRENELDDMTRALAHDRRLLADAWRRVEEQLVQPDQARPSLVVKTPQANTEPPTAENPSYLPDTTDDPITREVLRQFRQLSRDVRRNACKKAARR